MWCNVLKDKPEEFALVLIGFAGMNPEIISIPIKK